MSTVLWANYLVDGKLVCDEADKYALYKYSKKLDKLARRLGVTPFLDLQDTTDLQYNLSESPLPDGVETTDELMAISGVWVEAADVVKMLEALLREIEAKNIKFGLLSNAQDDVIDELKESLTFAKQAEDLSAKFNFTVVM